MLEETGLYYMRTRYYSPDLKRFINADILTGSIVDSGTMNQYSYVEGNPVSIIDPFGLCAEPSWWQKAKNKASGWGASLWGSQRDR